MANFFISFNKKFNFKHRHKWIAALEKFIKLLSRIFIMIFVIFINQFDKKNLIFFSMIAQQFKQKY